MKQLIFLGAILFLFSCSNEDPNELIDPSDPDAISEVLITPDGSSDNSGDPPDTSTSSQAPEAINSTPSVLSSNGSTAPLNFRYNNVNGNLGGCYVQVDGAGNYYTVPYNGTSGDSGSLQVPLGIPTNVDEGDFCINFCVYDRDGLVSNVVSTCVTVLRLGTGSLQVSLSWDTPTDQDLYVTDPSSTTIYYANDFSSTGGQLDRDDTDGFGPENIFWTEEAPDGEYSVEVDDFDNTSTPNTFYITVSGPNQSRNFSGTIQDGSRVSVVTFRKQGDNLVF